jgi:superfamily II DNA helicase RecQ
MQIQFFHIPVQDSAQATEEMNAFLRSHKIIDIEKHFVAAESNSFWSFCIRYFAGDAPVTDKKHSKIDYKEVLDEATFKIYSDLRECRKQISDKEAIPPYAVFTNEELANIAKLETITPSNLLSIKGIGKSKAEKYGITMLDLFNGK